jgi:hypothetical protein
MLKFKFKKMLKESREQTDRNALAVIRTEFSKSVPNLDLVLNLAKDNEILTNYIEGHLKDLGILDRLKKIDKELSEENPNFAGIITELSDNEALIAYYNKNEVFKEGCYKLGIKRINELIPVYGLAYSGGYPPVGGSWEEAWDAVSYDPEGEIEYALEVRLRLAKYFIEQLKEYFGDPRIPLMQLKDIDEYTPVQDEYDTDYRSARYTIDYKFLPKNLQIELINAIDDLVDHAIENERDMRDFEDTARSSWYY